MARPALEIADILDRHGDDDLRRHAGHLSLGQLEVISAVRTCRTAARDVSRAHQPGCRPSSTQRRRL